jgi:hypothetical protein
MQQPSALPLTERLREAAIARGEQFLAEVPATMLRLLVLVLSISVPAFLLACLALLAWRLLG